MEKLIEIIKAEELGEILLNESMKFHTTMRVGGKVACLFVPNSIQSLILVLKFVKENNINFYVLGKGSNMIFPDGDMDTIIIKIANIFDEVLQNNDEFTIGAGCSLQKCSKTLSKQGYSGLEFAGGIPGTIGGATFMNAGAHTHDMKSIIQSVTIIDEDLEIKTLSNEDCLFGYRKSIFQKKNYIIVEVKIKLVKGDPSAIFKTMAGNLSYRKEMQPLELPSCGSSFRNPEGHHAGKLIEECGLKGHMIGGAQVSEKHANFIVNVNEAKSSEIIELINYVKTEVFNKVGVTLIPEMEIFKVDHE